MRKLLIVLIILAFSIVCLCSCVNNTKTFETEIYYGNQTQNSIEFTNVKIKANNSEEVLNKALEKMFDVPKGSGYFVVFPENTKVNDAYVKDNTAYVDFSKEIFDLDQVSSILMRAAVVNTITSIKGINGVYITVDGEDYIDSNGEKTGVLHRTDIVLDAYGETTVTKYAKLYFADQEAQGLLPESREITVSDKETEEMQVVKQLVAGPTAEGLIPTIPGETKILSVDTKEGTCFVNFSEEFIAKHSGGTAGETLTIYSIVNSLTELDHVNQVQFLIEGQKRESFIHMIFNEPFSRNEAYIIKK